MKDEIEVYDIHTRMNPHSFDEPLQVNLYQYFELFDDLDTSYNVFGINFVHGSVELHDNPFLAQV